MRKLIVSEFVSLDGVMEGPGPDDPFKLAGWTMPYVSADFMAIKLSELMAADALLLGRVTYEGFAAAWPGRTDEQGFGDKMNSMKKYVVSNTDFGPKWHNTTVLQGHDLADAIDKLKQEPGDDMLVAGSSVLMETLVKHDLVDLYRLLVYPVVLGEGKRLFRHGVSATFKLAHSRALDSGVMLLEYTPNRA